MFVEKLLKEKYKSDNFYNVGSFFFYGLALFVFWVNLTGMIPETLTITAFIELPAYLSFLFFVTSFLMALEQTKYRLPRGFLPSGVPEAVGPFLYVIEVISYFIRLFSLAIRLFINILAGHMLLKIFSVIAWILVCLFLETLTVSLLIHFIEFVFVMLEYIACMLQAVVLVSLIAVYLDHGMHIYH